MDGIGSYVHGSFSGPARRGGEVSTEKYPVGTKVSSPDGFDGVVIPNRKMPGDICIEWTSFPSDVEGKPFVISYDEEFCDENFTVKP